LIDHSEQHPAALAKCLQSESKQDGEKQHLQDLTLCECPDHRVGDDIHQELNRALFLGLHHESLDRPGIDRFDIDVHTSARLYDIHDDKTDNQSDRRCDFEVDKSLEPDAANLLHVLHAGNAMHDGAEDDWSDDHLDHLDERVAQRLHLRAKLRIEVPERDAYHNGHQHLHIKALVKRLAVRCSCHRGFCVSHTISPCVSGRLALPAHRRCPSLGWLILGREAAISQGAS
jgi:hypothetical protein